MKYLFLVLMLFILVPGILAEEIDGEVDLSYVDPYQKIVPGFSISVHPEFLQWNRLSLGLGASLNVSSRFNYYSSPSWIKYDETDTSGVLTEWYYKDDDAVELINYRLYGEGRLNLFGVGIDGEESHFKSWLTLTFGFVDFSAIATRIQEIAGQERVIVGEDTTYQTIYDQRFTTTSKTQHSSSFFIEPGISFGIGNFIVGYKQMISFDDRVLEEGKSAENVFSVRVGYRFIW